MQSDIIPDQTQGTLESRSQKRKPRALTAGKNERLRLHYLHICVIKLTSEAQDNSRGKENRACLAAAEGQTQHRDRHSLE